MAYLCSLCSALVLNNIACVRANLCLAVCKAVTSTMCRGYDQHSVATRLVCLQVRVAALVQGILNISGASPRRYFFEVLQHFATAELEVDRLEYFATPEGRNDLYTYNQKEGEQTVVDTVRLCMFASC